MRACDVDESAAGLLGCMRHVSWSWHAGVHARLNTAGCIFAATGLLRQSVWDCRNLDVGQRPRSKSGKECACLHASAVLFSKLDTQTESDSDQPLRQNVVTGGGNSARGGAQPGKSSSVRPKSQENTFCWSVVGHMYIRPRTCRRVLASASRRQGPRARGGGRGRRAHRSPPPSQPSGRAAAKRLPRAQLRDKTGKHPTLREAAKQ